MPPTIVIGGGIAGLIQSIELSSLGENVILIEKESNLGGFHTPHYLEELDCFIDSVLPCYSSSASFTDFMNRHGLSDDISSSSPVSFRYHFPSFYCDVPSSYNAFHDLLTSMCPPQDQKPLLHALSKIQSLAYQFSQYYSMQDSHILTKIASVPLYPLTKKDLVLYYNSTVESLLTPISNSVIRSLLSFFCVLIGQPPSSMSCSFYANFLVNLFSEGATFGPSVNCLLNQLINRAKELGVTFMLNTTVKQILFEQDGWRSIRAKGVLTGDGSKVIGDHVYFTGNPCDLNRVDHPLISEDFSYRVLKRSGHFIKEIANEQLKSSFAAVHFVVNPLSINVFQSIFNDISLHYVSATTASPSFSSCLTKEDVEVVEVVANWEGWKSGNLNTCPLCLYVNQKGQNNYILSAFMYFNTSVSSRVEQLCADDVMVTITSRLKSSWAEFENEDNFVHVFYQESKVIPGFCPNIDRDFFKFPVSHVNNFTVLGSWKSYDSTLSSLFND
ncbi:hypothetical protein GEMRC1_002474 [Eukaryota sp. GEM-RC1]